MTLNSLLYFWHFSYFPWKELVVHAGRACMYILQLLVLGMKSHECELPITSCCMLEDVSLWNAPSYDPGTGFAKMQPSPPGHQDSQAGHFPRLRLSRLSMFCLAREDRLHVENNEGNSTHVSGFLTPKHMCLVTILSWESGSSLYPFEIEIFEESD